MGEVLVILGAFLLAVPGGVLLGHALATQPQPDHNPRTCRQCAVLGHPAGRAARRGRAVIPRQKRGHL